MGIGGGWNLITRRMTDIKVKVKVKCTLVQALRFCTGRTTHRGSRSIALLFLDHGSRRGEGSASRPCRSLPPGKTRYPFLRGLCGPQGRSGQVRKISHPPGFNPRTVQAVASRYPVENDRHTHMEICLWVTIYELMVTQNYEGESNKFSAKVKKTQKTQTRVMKRMYIFMVKKKRSKL